MAEFIGCVRRSGATAVDNANKAGVNNIVLLASKLEALEKELAHMFDVQDASGQPRVPWVIDPRFRDGYCNVVMSALDSEESHIITSGGKVLFFRPRADKTCVRNLLAKELGSILNVRKMFKARMDTVFDSSVAMSFKPFDLKLWQHHSDADISETLSPLAAKRNIDNKKLTRQFIEARPTAQRIAAMGDVCEGEIWMETLKRLEKCSKTCPGKPRWAELGITIHLSNCLLESTGVLEQDFQHLQALTAGRKSSTDHLLVESLFKIKLDGPPVEEFVACTLHLGSTPTYNPSCHR